MELVIKTYPTKENKPKNAGQYSFTGEFFQMFKELTSIFHKLF